MSKLVANQIVKTYSKKDVLHGVNLELESGKIYGLIGRNGARIHLLQSSILASTAEDVLPLVLWDLIPPLMPRL